MRLRNAELSGTFEDLDADGALLVRRTDDSLQRVTAGDVFFGHKTSAGV